MKRLIPLLCLAILAGCGAHRDIQRAEPPIVLNNTDSVRVETVIKTVYVPMEVNVDLPKQSEVNVTPNDSSHVETDLAFSNAWVRDGVLHHEIFNKSGSLKGSVFVPQTTELTSKDAVSSKEIPVTTPYAVEIERKFTLMEQIKLAAFWYLAVGIVISIGIIFRRPLFLAMRKMIRL